MDTINRTVVRKKTICKCTPSFGFSDINNLNDKSKFQKKRSSSSKVIPPSDMKEPASRKVARIYASQDDIHRNDNSPKKPREQTSLKKSRASSEEDVRKIVQNRKKEILKELHEKSKLLLQQNLKRKSQSERKKNAPSEKSEMNVDSLYSAKIGDDDVIKLSDKYMDTQIKLKKKFESNPVEMIESSDALLSEINIPIVNMDATREAAVIKIQKYYRGYKNRMNIKKTMIPNNKEDRKDEVQLDESTNKNCSDLGLNTVKDLFVSYPFNVMSSVKHKILVEDNSNTANEDKNNSLHRKIKEISTNFNFEVNEKTLIPFPEKSTSSNNIQSNLSKKNCGIINGLRTSLDDFQNLVSPLKVGKFTQEQDSIIKNTSVGTISTSSNSNSNAFHKNESILDAPKVNLIWVRNGDKITSSPKLSQSRFQDELNLLESFNDSLRQVQYIEKSLTSIRGEDLSSSEIDCDRENSNYDNSTGITFVGSSDLSVVHKYKTVTKTNNQISKSKNHKTMEKSGQIPIQKCLENDKSIILSQNDNISINSQEDSELFYSENHSMIEKSIGSCISSVDLSSYDKRHIFDFSSHKNSNMTNRLNKFCLCLVNQYIEDEKVRAEYLNTLLKVREKTLLDATRNELLCLEIQKKNNQSQIPLLKKKQRGLLLKLQQERNEIKHIKKFQQEQSQERKASLRRQLKHLKQMLACDEVLVNMKRKNKKSSAILSTSINSVNSPLKGINIPLGNESQKSNNSLTKIWESLEKRRQDLNEQKKKMQDILHLHFNNILDTAEIKVIQDKLSNTSKNINTENQGKGDKVQNKESEELMSNLNSIKFENDVNNKISSSCNKQDVHKQVNGSTLNNLWEKITGQICDKFENRQYDMTKDSLEVFFNDAKQVAINNIMNGLHSNVNTESAKSTCLVEHFENCFGSTKIEGSSFLNNLLKSEGRELADLISKDKSAQQEIKNNELSKSHRSIYSESNDSSDHGDTSKSTANSLIEELSYLYPNAKNYADSEINIFDTQNTSSTMLTERLLQQQPEEVNFKESDKIQMKQVEGNSSDNCKSASKPGEIFNNKTSVIVQQSSGAKSLPYSLSETNKGKPTTPNESSSGFISEKLIKVSKSTDTIDNSVVKRDANLDNSMEITPKRFYSDDRSISRLLENNSPINADYLSGSWESVSPSPDPSPRDSPTGEYSPAAASLPLCHLNEAEELRRKQLAIELEIKALEQQQSHLPYCLVREIPDKPPPPYIPPSDEIKVASIKTVEIKTPPSIPNLIESFCLWLWSQFSNGKSTVATYNEYCTTSKFSINLQDHVFVFDVCYETFEYEFEQLALLNDTTHMLPWDYKKESNSRKKNVEKDEMCNKVQKNVKELIGIETTPIRENLIISWTQKRQDFVNNLLIKELYKEESDWLNIEPYEIDIKNNLTSSILESLLIEACNELKYMYF